MTGAQRLRRVAVLEAQLAAEPPALDLEAVMPWLPWTTDAELDALEAISCRATAAGITDLDELSEDDRARWVEIVAAAERRMAAGEPR